MEVGCLRNPGVYWLPAPRWAANPGNPAMSFQVEEWKLGKQHIDKRVERQGGTEEGKMLLTEKNPQNNQKNTNTLENLD